MQTDFSLRTCTRVCAYFREVSVEIFCRGISTGYLQTRYIDIKGDTLPGHVAVARGEEGAVQKQPFVKRTEIAESFSETASRTDETPRDASSRYT